MGCSLGLSLGHKVAHKKADYNLECLDTESYEELVITCWLSPHYLMTGLIT